MVQRHLCHGKADLDTASHHGQRSSKTNRVDIGADAVEMMLCHPHRIKAKLLGQLGLRDGFIDDAYVQRRFAALGKQEVAELHIVLLFGELDLAEYVACAPVRYEPAMSRNGVDVSHEVAGLAADTHDRRN